MGNKCVNFTYSLPGFSSSVSSINVRALIFSENSAEYLKQKSLGTMSKMNLLYGQQLKAWEI